MSKFTGSWENIIPSMATNITRDFLTVYTNNIFTFEM